MSECYNKKKKTTDHGLTEEVCVVRDGVESQVLQVLGHQRGSTVEERLQLLLVLVARHLLPLVALVEDVLHLGKPPAGQCGELVTFC